MKKIFLIFCIVVGLIGIGMLLFTFYNPKNTTFGLTQSPESAGPTPTPMPFEELTIPALRKRSYDSELGPLHTVSTNAQYTSYSTFFMSDGLKVNGQLTIPRGDRPIEGWSAIIFIHGYIPPTTYQTFQNYSSYVDYLAKSGFVVFKIDLRGHGQSEGEPGGAYYSADYVVDALSAREALRNSDFVNPDKIGLWGHSMAGNVVMRSLTVKPEIPAVSIWGGAVYTYLDMQKYGISDNSYRPPQISPTRRITRQRLEEVYGKIDPQNVFWSRFIPTNYLSDIKGAVQLNHAVDDEVVSIGYSRDLNEFLNATPVRHEFHEYPTGGHNFTGTTFNQAMQRTVEFYRRNL